MMYKCKCKSLVVAEAVMESAMNMINSDEGQMELLRKVNKERFQIIVECYQNGREQGLIALPVFKSDICYYVCQPRSADGICIYKGESRMQSISEDAYAHPNEFECVEKAAEWLVKDLIGIYLVYIEKRSHLFVRTYCPRVATSYVDVIEGGDLTMVPNTINVGEHLSEID